jgi:hypothetical protein
MRLLKAFGLPSLLLVLVVLTHYSYDLIASFYANQLAAAKAWHSVLRAGEATLLYLVVWSLVPLKPAAVRYGTAVACAWGVFESAQIAVCRLHYPMDRPPARHRTLYRAVRHGHRAADLHADRVCRSLHCRPEETP